MSKLITLFRVHWQWLQALLVVVIFAVVFFAVSRNLWHTLIITAIVAVFAILTHLPWWPGEGKKE